VDRRAPELKLPGERQVPGAERKLRGAERKLHSLPTSDAE
jgi:hypothetical protein